MNSKISKLYANPELAAAISGSKGTLDSFIQNDYYRALLQFKTSVQFGKTILSPEGQIRNAVTNVGFPIMYGWIGGKTSITDSFKKVAGDIYGAGKEFNTPAFLRDIEKLTKLGVLDDNIIAQELSAVLKQLQEGKINSLDGLLLKLSKTKFITNATRTFQGGDNAWRLYGYLWNNSFFVSLKPFTTASTQIERTSSAPLTTLLSMIWLRAVSPRSISKTPSSSVEVRVIVLLPPRKLSIS